MLIKQVERIFRLVLLGFLFCMPALVFAATKEYRWGIAVGFGGTGLKEATTIGTEEKTVTRSEGPGVFMIFGDRQLSSRWGLTLEHARGFRLGPVSSGAHFTGMTFRWYPMTPAPVLESDRSPKSYVFHKTYIPFAGFSTGFASGHIVREEDQVPVASASGVYIGTRLGADYLLEKDTCLRGEMSYSTTLVSSPQKPSSMSEFSLRVGWVFPF